MFKIDSLASLVINGSQTALGCLQLQEDGVHKWKADTTKLKGIGKVDDPNEGVSEGDDPNEGVGEANDLNKVVGEVEDPDDPDKGVGKADDPNKGVSEANNADKGVGEVDNPIEVVGEADYPIEVVGETDYPDEVVDEADDLDVALLGLHVCIYEEISCAPRLVLIKRLLQGKDSEQYAYEDSYKEKNSTPRKRGQPFTTIKIPNTFTNQGAHN